jgi:hypothetical protein
LLVGLVGCTSFYEITIETPIQPKLDVSPFSRVLVAGFIAGGTEDVDANLETVRLLRSQLRTKSGLKVIEADVVPLAELAAEQVKDAGTSTDTTPAAQDGAVRQDSGSKQEAAAKQDAAPKQDAAAKQEPGLPKHIKDQKDLQAYEHIFADANFWKKLGEEYQNPLIVTGTILFTPHARSGFVQREQEQYDAFGRRSVVPVRTYMERKGFILNPKFVFIDGRTGTPLYSETFREEILYNPQQNTPALSSYFELMDRIIPNFLSTLSSQKVRGTRILLK